MTLDLANGLLVGMHLEADDKEKAHELLNDFFLGNFSLPIDLPG